jgi:hypothetical protein
MPPALPLPTFHSRSFCEARLSPPSAPRIRGNGPFRSDGTAWELRFNSCLTLSAPFGRSALTRQPLEHVSSSKLTEAA